MSDSDVAGRVDAGPGQLNRSTFQWTAVVGALSFTPPYIARVMQATIRLAVVFTVLLFSYSFVSATPVFKCTVDGSVTYQRDPCPSSETRKFPTIGTRPEQKSKQRRTGPAEAKTQQDNDNRHPSTVSNSTSPPDSKNERSSDVTASNGRSAISFRCDGRKYCSQMVSCTEAKYFLANCPNVEMDGDNNGIPCERQWCSK